MVQSKFINNLKSSPIDIPAKGENRNKLWNTEWLEKVDNYGKSGVWKPVYKLLHLGFTAFYMFRLLTLILSENLGLAFVDISKEFYFTSAGLNLEPVVNNLLWLSVVILQADALWHVHVSYNLFSGTGDELITFDRMRTRMRLQFFFPQILLVVLIASHLALQCATDCGLGSHESYETSSTHLITNVLLSQSYCTIVVSGYSRMLENPTPHRLSDDLLLQFCIPLSLGRGLRYLDQFKIRIGLFGLQIPITFILCICLCLMFVAPSCIKWLNKAKQSPTPTGGGDGIATITVT